jgi:MFS family permease
MWYQREEMQFRQALFFSAASVAGAFSGLLAYAINNMDGVAGVAGWRWIFILEGIATVVIAAPSVFLLHDFPETAAFLTEEERAFVVWRLKYQGQVDGVQRVAQAEEFKWRYVWDAFLDWQVWVNIWVYWGVSIVRRSCCCSHNDRLSVLSTASACSSRRSSRICTTRRARHS